MRFGWMSSVLSLVTLLALAGCDGAVVDSGEKPGLGDSTASPTGTPFTLPPGLELDEQPRGYSFYGDERCPDIDEALVHGSGGLVTLCLSFRNTTSDPIELVLPPGLIFVSKSLDLQNGLLTEPVGLLIPPESVESIVVATYCANLFRSVPGGGEEYSIGPITDDPDLLELLEILGGVDLPSRYDDSEDAEYVAETVQGAVWDITDWGGLTDETRAELEAIVEAYGG